ncbi:MAG: UvrD-helicase domain-containing protein [Deltaproteobacteria bacterium]|jgi:exodeoxyribonuclease V beta subunit|nr:UvrD-helicase domain-containing protein [Deltaproteobacteria bacterium]MBW2532295.1 UvrD-helicase domain-containing protein [Deltaproteobacteria bacterium]
MSRARSFRALDVALGGTKLVTASAGTGKTYAITTLFVRLLLERGLEVDQILVVTFTEAATAELRARIRSRLQDALLAFRAVAAGGESGDDDLDEYARTRRGKLAADQQRLQAAIQNVDEASISTIHGFCHRMLHQSAFESGVLFEAELMTDLAPLRSEVVHDFWANTMSAASEQEVRLIEAAGLVPSGCASLADKATAMRDVTIVPDEPGDPFAKAVADARPLWDREVIVDRVWSQPGFTTKQRKTVEGWADKVDAYLSGPEPELPKKHTDLPVGIRNLSTKGLAKLYVGGPPPEHPFFEAAQTICDARLAYRDRGPVVVGFRKALVDYVRAELPRRKEQAGAMSFDDLLYLLRDALAGPSGERLAEVIRSHYRAALIDEFQDTDPVQFAIFRGVYATTGLPLFLIGDPKQAIYAFRGADIFAFLRAVATTDDERFTMGVNWRSDPSLIRAVGELFRGASAGQLPKKRPFLLDGIDYPEVGPRPEVRDACQVSPPFVAAPLELLFVPRSDALSGKTALKERLPERIAADISALLRSDATIDGRPVLASDVAVLTRTNAQAFEIQLALRRLQIPAVVIGDQSVFGSDEAEQLERVLAAVVEPTNSHEARRAMTTDLLGVTANRLAAMENEPAEWDRWGTLLREASQLWVQKGFVQMLRALMAATDLQARLLRLSDGERRLTNVLHLMELLHEAGQAGHLGPAGLLHWLGQQRTDSRAGVDNSEIRLESDAAAVKLSTVHKAKGLEYGIVYCPYLWDGALLHQDDQKVLRFHDDDGRLVLDLGSLDFEEHEARAELYEALAENLRILYVALTRAKHRCSVVWTAIGADTSALAYLLHPPEVEPDAELHIRDFADRLQQVGDEQMTATLEARGAACGGAIGWRLLDLETPGVIVPRQAEAAAALQHREVAARIRSWWRTASYSTLTAGHSGSSLDEAEGRDRDEQTGEIEEALGVVVGQEPAAAPEPILLADFFRGARAGNFFHEIFEQLDFRDDVAIEPLVRDKLGAYGFSADHEALVAQAIRDVLATPLLGGADAFALRDVPMDQRLAELEFYLPVASTAASAGDAQPLTPQSLATVFRQYRSQAVPQGYAADLGRLGFARLHGFLKGYVDLLFEQGGRFYVLDYKTNYLGSEPASYGRSAMTQAMAHGHYFLQYHLYCLAAHRYLARRLPSYDYDEHFGGALYLFVRGMSPKTGPKLGVFHDKPTRSFIEAFSAVLDGTRDRGAA